MIEFLIIILLIAGIFFWAAIFFFNFKILDGKMNNQCLYVACSRCGQLLKELTDEEIKSVWEKMVCSVHMTKAELDFARAILRKAQE